MDRCWWLSGKSVIEQVIAWTLDAPTISHLDLDMGVSFGDILDTANDFGHLRRAIGPSGVAGQDVAKVLRAQALCLRAVSKALADGCG